MKISNVLICSLTFIISLPFNIGSSDFYELLGVKKDADSKEIRRAFKKLALTMHPDKNIGDPDAHDEFIKINKAYEILKDPDTRKKYDTYGEDGLKEDFGSGWKGNFHSWNYYHESFGIYDDDPEIITLSKTDFERTVDGSDTIWFINFYSPQCSHCHDLAPDWRQLGRDLEGVIRVGAVNCEEDWSLCRQLNIRSYPTLMLFPQELNYHGQRDLESLTEFVLGEIPNTFLKLNTEMFKTMFNQANAKLSWFIYFCTNIKECWDMEDVKKISIMLDGLVTVGYVDCTKGKELCDLLGHKSEDSDSWLWFKGLKETGDSESKSVIEGEGRKEVFNKLLMKLPDPETLSSEKYNKLREDLKAKSDDVSPNLVFFKSQKDSSLANEIKILKSLLSGVELAQIDCDSNEQICNSLYLKKLPAFIIFKAGGGFEVFHGDTNVHDLSLFVSETTESRVHTLLPQDFPGKVVHSSEPWFVDFFAPWCPPCMNLLPEWRKASKAVGDVVNFGTVDCTIHTGVCSSYEIKSYPTTILFNQTEQHQFFGRHSAQDLVEFVEDTLNPVVVSLTPVLFSSLIETKDENVIWAVEFFAPWCGPCQKLGPHWRRMAKAVLKESNIKVGQIDCQAHQSLCRKNGVSSYPTLRVYPLGSINSEEFQTFNGWSRDSESLKAWVKSFLPTVAKSLSSNEFTNEVIKSSDSWLVDFYAPWCGHCQVFAPVFEEIAKQLEGKVKAGKINCDKHGSACQLANIRAFPTLRFYAGSVEDQTQEPLGTDINSQDEEYILQFIKRRIQLKEKKLIKEEL